MKPEGEIDLLPPVSYVKRELNWCASRNVFRSHEVENPMSSFRMGASASDHKGPPPNNSMSETFLEARP